MISPRALFVFLLLAAPSQPLELPKHSVPIGNIAADDLAPALKKLHELADEGQKHLMLRIDSRGGALDDGWAFVQEVEDLKKEYKLTIDCSVDTKALSFGFVVLQDVCDRRYATSRSYLMCHDAHFESSDVLNEQSLGQFLEKLRIMDHGMEVVVSKRMGMTPEALREQLAKGDWNMSAEDALAAHAIDAILDPSEVPPAYNLDKPEKIDIKALLGL